MENKTDFKPYIPADKVMPEFSVTAAVLGCILAILFGAANAYLGLRVGMTVSASGSCNLHGSDPHYPEKGFHSGEQHGTDHRFCR